MNEVDTLFGTLAGYFAVLAEPGRLKIMHMICDRERSVSAIAAATGMSQPNVSRQLGFMLQRGLVVRRRDGNRIFYRVADETMPEVCRAVCARIAARMYERRPLRRRLLRLMPRPRKRRA